jgi:hypothetical protein
MKQTAVEWLEEQTRKPEWHSLKRQDIFEQAKEMEKQQIKDAVEWNYKSNMGEVYYNAVYKNKTK